MIVSDQSGVMLRASSVAPKLLQFEATEMLGQSVNMLMPEPLAVLHDGFILHHIETGEKRIIGLGRDVEGQRKDGTVCPLHLSVGHKALGDQRIFVGIPHDLMYRKATEEALARVQQLYAIGQMTVGIAHDFNSLLTLITGNLELLEMRGADARQLPLIKDALKSAELRADLTTRLMVFARLSILNPVITDLRAQCPIADLCQLRTPGPVSLAAPPSRTVVSHAAFAVLAAHHAFFFASIFLGEACNGGI